MKDNYGRNINYLRISITDRCNLRCRYCMPDGIQKVSMDRILSYEDILRISEAATRIGIRRFKITGGEPLVRLGCTDLIRELKALPLTEQVTMTTNGMELAKYMPDLVDAGLDAVNVSLDTMDREKFTYITKCGDLDRVMEGIEAAVASGIRTKINCVPQKGFNDNEIADFAAFAFEKGIDVRFIELMPIGASDSGKGLSNEAILETLTDIYPELTPDDSIHGNGPAVYYTIPGQKGSIGLISAICSWAVTMALYAAVYRQIMTNIDPTSFYAILPVRAVIWWVLVLALFTGILIGSIGSGISVRKYIKV